MDNIKPYIDAGWWTVPILGTIERLPDGTKTVPKFTCKGWREKYYSERNEQVTRLGGVITGENSNIVAIDCDNELTYNMFKALDPDYKAVFMSKGKGKTCGTFIYKFDPRLKNFSTKKHGLELDYYAENGFIYLATAANKTKELWTEIPDITEMPETTFTLLLQINKSASAATVVNKDTGEERANFLAPLVEEFVKKKEFMPVLFKIITPKAFRDEEQYLKKGYLHPDNVPEGAGSVYLSKVSCILGGDPSIDETLYVEAMHTINALWSNPMPADRLDATICDRMLNKSVTINDQVVWQYDKNWQARRLALRTKRQTLIEIVYDDNRRAYYVVDMLNEKSMLFSSDNELQAHCDTVLVNTMSKKEMKAKIPLVNIVSNPAKDFGFYESLDVSVRDFNNFKQTPALKIFRNPDAYKPHYKRPDTIIRYIETLVPEEKMRLWLLGFIKKKFETFNYSPAVLFFLGTHGSGKDTFVNMLEHIMGTIARPSAKIFLEKHNGWLLDAYFVQLDEYGNQLSTVKEKEEALGLVKAYSGKKTVNIRTMRADSVPYEHSATFIMTQNKNPLMIENEERRLAFFYTPNNLAKQEWVSSCGGIVEVINLIENEIKDFCYYLATEVKDISMDAYVCPPDSIYKHTIIADSMFAAQRIAYAMKNGMQDYLVELAKDYDCPEAVTAFQTCSVYTSDLEYLYMEMTDQKGDMRSLTKSIRSMGIPLVPSTKDGGKAFKCKLNWNEGSPFGEDNDYDAQEF